jgi:DEAD/DEAH box helicase domain-containing protein
MRDHLIDSIRMNIVYFDLETQRTANDVGGWAKKQDMGMSVGVTYSTALNEYRIFPEKRVNDLVQQLIQADLVVGFNLVHFDYEVLMGYTILDLPHQLRTLDLLVEIENSVGNRLRLDNIAQATLGVGKTAEGVDAIKWWRERRLMEIAEYCCFDVKVTKLVHEHGIAHRELFYTDKFSRKHRVEIKW